MLDTPKHVSSLFIIKFKNGEKDTLILDELKTEKEMLELATALEVKHNSEIDTWQHFSANLVDIIDETRN